jgi:hypothetical protein
MKNPPKKNPQPGIAITATLEEPCLLQILVEKLAECNPDMGYNLEQVQPGSKAIETSSIEVLVSGDINLSNKKDLIDIPFVTCFLFTCIKASEGKYDLTWSSSLS